MTDVAGTGQNKIQLFKELSEKGIHPTKACKLLNISQAYYYKTIRPAMADTDYLTTFSPKSPDMVKLAYTRLKGILKDKEAKNSDTISAIKIVLDRSHPINEPVVQANQQFIQINVGRLQEAVKAINAMSSQDPIVP